MAGKAAAIPGGKPALPPLVTVTSFVSELPQLLYMCTDNSSMTKSSSLFKAADGAIAFSLENDNGIFREKKILRDGEGNVVLTAKKFALSLAKWTICLPNGTVVAKTRTISGLAKYGVEVDVPSAPRTTAKSTFTIVPEPSNSKVIMWQNNGKGKEDTPMCVAAYGENVFMGILSAAIQDWTYHVSLDPGADAALVCCLLVIYTDLLEWNALGAASW